MIKKQGWEGLVLWDKTQGSTYSLEGKTLRPLSCFKRKLVQEDDFIVRDWESSKNDSARMAKLYLSQIDPNTRQEFSCGACGGGFTNQWRKELANDKLYPFVAEIKFFKRFSSGALFSSKFFRIRTDKKIKECIAPKSFVFKKRKRKEKK